MKNILKFGLMSAVTAVALAQIPAADYMQGMDEDILAIASRGALSDSMPGFRKLADDEAGSILGGAKLSGYYYGYGIRDNFGFQQFYTAYYHIDLNNRQDQFTYSAITGVERGAIPYYMVTFSYTTGWRYQVVKFNPSNKLVIPLTGYEAATRLHNELQIRHNINTIHRNAMNLYFQYH